MIYAVGHISGAHFNPAVTHGFAVGRHFPWADVPRYWAAQLVGGIAASLLLRSMFGDVAHLGTTLPYGSAWQSFVLEAVLTFVLMFVITSVATEVRAVGQAAAIAIGGTIGLEALFAGPISGSVRACMCLSRRLCLLNLKTLTPHLFLAPSFNSQPRSSVASLQIRLRIKKAASPLAVCLTRFRDTRRFRLDLP